ncbi:hypothetical protein [Salipiger mucosus]|uniref:Uncharacterized protein n=1 Tax=Salipiger mucosus DSM 16094 TaxID=1123237 RepID=S9S625_9RHOB|nr:hypothetical protein [Salipiger mucosus]EPX85620.1 hypothetical protein Salmuc_04891 [Salipiger mucosus DSM 16094]
MSDQVDAPRKPSVFLERQSYRRRRIIDAARVLPLLGLLLWLIPLLWTDEGVAGVRSSTAIVYLFSVWLVLVVLSCVVSTALAFRDGPQSPPHDDEAAQ